MNKLFLWIAAASAFVLQSCENTDGIRDEIGSLRDRVIALEAKIGSVNTSIVALHKLMDESTIIVGIEPNAKGYEIELSDGTRLPVILGEKIEALVPVMGIDAEGYWTVVTSPACRIQSQPFRISSTSGRRRLCVSDIIPILFAIRLRSQFFSHPLFHNTKSP